MIPESNAVRAISGMDPSAMEGPLATATKAGVDLEVDLVGESPDGELVGESAATE